MFEQSEIAAAQNVVSLLGRRASFEQKVQAIQNLPPVLRIRIEQDGEMVWLCFGDSQIMFACCEVQKLKSKRSEFWAARGVERGGNGLTHARWVCPITSDHDLAAIRSYIENLVMRTTSCDPIALDQTPQGIKDALKAFVGLPEKEQLEFKLQLFLAEYPSANAKSMMDHLSIGHEKLKELSTYKKRYAKDPKTVVSTGEAIDAGVLNSRN